MSQLATLHATAVRLSAVHLPAMRAHLLRLNEHDRYQRFAHAATDALIEQYLAKLDFDRDAHFGIWSSPAEEAEPRLAALAHMAIDRIGGIAEVGVSVDANERRQGLATRLLHRSVLHARNLCLGEVAMYFLPYNRELIELARSLGMRLSASDGLGMARLWPQPPDAGSVGAEVLEAWASAAGKSVAHVSEGAAETAAGIRRALGEMADGERT